MPMRRAFFAIFPCGYFRLPGSCCSNRLTATVIDQRVGLPFHARLFHREMHESTHLALRFAVVPLQGCLRNQTVTAYGAAAQVWELEQMTETGGQAEQICTQETTLRPILDSP